MQNAAQRFKGNARNGPRSVNSGFAADYIVGWTLNDNFFASHHQHMLCAIY